MLTLAWRSGGQGRQAALGTGGHQPPRVGGQGWEELAKASEFWSERKQPRSLFSCFSLN